MLACRLRVRSTCSLSLNSKLGTTGRKSDEADEMVEGSIMDCHCMVESVKAAACSSDKTDVLLWTQITFWV
jgi:hypothetical protein